MHKMGCGYMGHNVVLDPIMHGKCTMHEQRGVAMLEQVSSMKPVLHYMPYFSCHVFINYFDLVDLSAGDSYCF